MTDAVIRRAGPEDAETLARISAQTFCDTFAHLYPPEDLAAYLAEAYDVDATRASLPDPAYAAWLVGSGGETIGHALAGPCGLPHPDASPKDGELKRLY